MEQSNFDISRERHMVNEPRIVAEASNISKRFGATQALKDVSIKIREGEIHGLVGRNGAGKSTLVGVLTGLISPDSGQVFLNSEPVPKLSDREKMEKARCLCISKADRGAFLIRSGKPFSGQFTFSIRQFCSLERNAANSQGGSSGMGH